MAQIFIRHMIHDNQSLFYFICVRLIEAINKTRIGMSKYNLSMLVFLISRLTERKKRTEIE